MFPAIWAVLRTYAPIITLPVAAVVGVLGYAIENMISDKYTPYRKSVEEEREDRMLQEVASSGKTSGEKLEENASVPKTIFDNINLSPQLRKDDYTSKLPNKFK